MQVRIHGLSFVFIFLAETHIGNRLPILGKCLPVPPQFTVFTAFDLIKLFLCIVQGFSTARCTVIFRKRIERKTLCIRLFFAVYRAASEIKFPKYSAIFFIHKVVPEVQVCAFCDLPVGTVAQHTVGRSKCPQDPGMHDDAFVGHPIQYIVTVDAAIKTTMLRINHFIHPIRKDIIFNFFFKSFHCFSSLHFRLIATLLKLRSNLLHPLFCQRIKADKQD